MVLTYILCSCCLSLGVLLGAVLSSLSRDRALDRSLDNVSRLKRQVRCLEEANSVQANQIRELKRVPTEEEIRDQAMASLCEMKRKLASGEGIPFKIMEIEHTPDGPMTTMTDTTLKMTPDGEVVLE